MTKTEARSLQTHLVPAWAFDAFNALVAERLGTDDEVTIPFPDLCEVVRKRAVLQGIPQIANTASPITDMILSSYRQAGWKIAVDRPDYTENRATMVTFK